MHTCLIMDAISWDTEVEVFDGGFAGLLDGVDGFPADGVIDWDAKPVSMPGSSAPQQHSTT